MNDPAGMAIGNGAVPPTSVKVAPLANVVPSGRPLSGAGAEVEYIPAGKSAMISVLLPLATARVPEPVPVK